MGDRYPEPQRGGTRQIKSATIQEGQGGTDFLIIKKMAYERPDLLHHILDITAQSVTSYLNAQIEAGAQAVQLFDSWVGCLGPDDYREHVLPFVRQIVDAIRPGVPVISEALRTTPEQYAAPMPALTPGVRPKSSAWTIRPRPWA